MSNYDLTKSHRLKALEIVVNQTQCPYRVNSVVITHVLPTSEEYLDLINQIFPIQLVIAIPYSADKETLERIKKKGILVYLPLSVEDVFMQAGPMVEEILASSTTPLIVQEVGGYLAGYTLQLSKYSHFKGIVEDTNNGQWRYEAMGEHLCPILSIAKSPIKDIEDTAIGDGVIYSTERVFREEFHAILQGCKCGVIGYGKIGTSVAIALRGRECQVNVYDVDPAKNIRARFEGFNVLPLHQLLSQCDLIVGCTGQTSLNREDIHFIKSNAILVSATAKNEEFNLNDFNEEYVLEKSSFVVWHYSHSSGKKFYLLNQGTPINFRDRSILGNILDLIYTELFVCMRVIAYEQISVGLQPSTKAIHSEVAKSWLSVYEEAFHQQPQDKVWTFPKELNLSYPKTYFLQLSQRQKNKVSETLSSVFMN